jgi:hypothetical protein
LLHRLHWRVGIFLLSRLVGDLLIGALRVGPLNLLPALLATVIGLVRRRPAGSRPESADPTEAADDHGALVRFFACGGRARLCYNSCHDRRRNLKRHLPAHPGAWAQAVSAFSCSSGRLVF